MDGLQINQKINSYIIDSQEAEIKRIALELHEGVGQNLYSILTGLQFVESGLSEQNMKSYVHEMSELIEKTIQEIRLLSVELHPPTLTTFGLLPAMKSYLKLYTSTFGILVDLTTAGEEAILPERSKIAVFRVCQEALTNIAKYADTSKVKMTFHWSGAELKITIDDFGKGFQLEDHDGTHASHSLGIAMMKERMHLTGGKCEISSKIGEGTSIKLSLPL
ncbi:ATP-binding protein [Neobacillus drentensis]|uniref:sensor histidine kinase n=1 Tax=Neobacillus drentensis TaxID=220684 RepID=UPI001F1F29D1|nr:ATP-binding protein [Neobacillus drentensis]ULT57823.1 ATP-binding protein [Neobacillus drentensis]